MQIEHLFPWHRIAQTLDATPLIIGRLIVDMDDIEADYRPDSERLTIREVVAHLDGWEAVALRQMERTCHEDIPVLGDAGSVGTATPAGIESLLSQFDERRAETVALLSVRTRADWAREAIRPTYGPTSLDAQAVMLMMHDTYHIAQIVEWRRLYVRPR